MAFPVIAGVVTGTGILTEISSLVVSTAYSPFATVFAFNHFGGYFEISSYFSDNSTTCDRVIVGISPNSAFTAIKNSCCLLVII